MTLTLNLPARPWRSANSDDAGLATVTVPYLWAQVDLDVKASGCDDYHLGQAVIWTHPSLGATIHCEPARPFPAEHGRLTVRGG